jgi:organic hydroperoxide reductase OsmC/OhrA
MERRHAYRVEVAWTGAASGPTKTYDGYSRTHEVRIEGKPAIAASADPAFRGDAAMHNPEQLLVAALASCHLLAYLALCAREGIAVVGYRDLATGTMSERAGAGHFTSVTLRPEVTIDGERLERARALHMTAHEQCFIANSVNFPVVCEPTIARAK